jgi:hypothetical protein
LVTMITMVLKKNNFTFNGDHYLQINDTAIGTKMAPSYANIFMGKLEMLAKVEIHKFWDFSTGMTVSRDNRSTWVIGFVDFGKKIESARFGTVWY